MLYQVEDMDSSEVSAIKYDLGVFAVGYEQRCTHIALHTANPRDIDQSVVLGFDELKDDKQRSANQEIFAAIFPDCLTEDSAESQSAVLLTLQEAAGAYREHMRILVDYTSMSRLWYAAILRWALHATCFRKLTIDFVYAVGEHRNEIPAHTTTAIVAIPGCEGRREPGRHSLGIFGLGFDSLAVQCVASQLDPREVQAFIADPAYFPDYPQRALEANAHFVDEHLKHRGSGILRLPISSVETSHRILVEAIKCSLDCANITLVPLGPKPHVLASILAAVRFPEVTCLRVNSRALVAEEVRASGDVVATRVTFVNGVTA